MSIALRRLLAQRLIGEPFDDAASAVGWLTAVQAQDFAGAKWALGQRVANATDARIDDAYQRGKILRTHVLRPTWHFVLPADIRWLLSLTAPRVHAANAGTYRMLELEPRTFRKSETVLARALERDGHQTRAELKSALEGAGIGTEGLRLGYLMMHAELEAVICSGPRRGKQFTYALVDELAPPAKPLARDEALTRLARRYFESHGPATAHDFAWWAGLTLTDARSGLARAESALVRHDVVDKTYWSGRPRTQPKLASPVLRMLPNYDEFLVAYKDHSKSFDRKLLSGRVGKRDEVLGNHLIVSDGLVIGGWRRTLTTAAVRIEATLLAKLDARGKRGLQAEAARFGRFLGLPATLRQR